MQNLKKELLTVFKSGGGYTLIEIMVAVGIFTVVIAAPTGFFVSSLKGQQKALASQELFDNVSYSLEYISRTLRMAKKDLTGACLGSVGLNYAKTNSRSLGGVVYSGPGIKFKNYQSVCQEIFWDTRDNRLKESKNGASPIPLTSDDIKIVSFAFGPETSWDQNDNEQPRITLSMEIKGARGQRSELQPEMKIQTTISQRNLDVTY